MSDPRHHLVISGTGRAGTTFLVQLLTQLGLDTGFADPETARSRYYEHPRAGLEWDVRHADAPYVVKDPLFCEYAGEVYANSAKRIDHLIVPIRDLTAAAESRREVYRYHKSRQTWRQRIRNRLIGAFPLWAGSYWNRESHGRGRQEQVLLEKQYELLLATASAGVPVILLHYPTHVLDASYAFRQLSPVLPKVEYTRFARVHQCCSRPELVHRYSEKDVPR